MKKHIPYQKLSKKEKRKIDAAKRTTWGELNPVTRKPRSSKAYSRNKSRNWKREYHETSSGTFHIPYFLRSMLPSCSNTIPSCSNRCLCIAPPPKAKFGAT